MCQVTWIQQLELFVYLFVCTHLGIWQLKDLKEAAAATSLEGVGVSIDDDDASSESFAASSTENVAA